MNCLAKALISKPGPLLFKPAAGIAIGISLFICAHLSLAEDTITLKSGKVLTGKIKNENVSIVVLEVGGKTRIVKKAKIQSIKRAEQFKEEKKSSPVGTGFVEVDDFTLLPRGNYSYELGKAIDEAQKSIDVVMYFISTAATSGYNPTEELINKLIKAKNRGVEVRVVVENQLVPRHIKERNEAVVEKLRDAGVDARLDVQKRITHTKLVIIDDYITFVGSHNWTRAGLSENQELSCMIKSPRVAAAFKEHAQDIFKKSQKRSS